MFETGLSYFHKLTVTVLKRHFIKAKPKMITYRAYKKFSNEKFCKDLEIELKKMACNRKYDDFHLAVVETLDRLAPLKKKHVRSNQKDFMDKELNQAVMHRSKLKNKYIKFNTDENRRSYKKQKNFCVNLFRRKKKQYYSNLDVKNVTDNKLFWKTVGPLFSNKNSKTGKMILVEKEIIIKEEVKLLKHS